MTDPSDAMDQLRAAAERLWTGSPGSRPVLPAVDQLEAVLEDLAARREQVRALREQLGVFDSQLAGLEAVLEPLVEWVRVWSKVERSVAESWRLPPAT